jgi:mannose-6-phosphate isomerase-like protein (cupin superfamily)
MIWSEVRKAYPEQWLIIEALAAHTEGNQRRLDRIAVIETCTDGAAAMQSYQRLHHEYPVREFYFVHTGRETLDIRERHWIGIRRGDAAHVER